MRLSHLACAAGLLAGAVIGGRPEIGAAQAAPVVVTTGTAWAAAWADPTVAAITLGADLELACGEMPLRPGGAVPLAVDGGHHVLTDGCADGVPRLASFASIGTDVTTWTAIAVVGAEDGFIPALLLGEAHLADVDVTGRNDGETVIVGSRSTIVGSTITGGGVGVNVSSTPVTIDDVDISGTGEGVIALSGDEPLVIRGSRVEALTRTLAVEVPTTIERSSLVSVRGTAWVGAPAVIRDSTLAITEPRVDAVSGVVLSAGPGGGEVVIEHATLVGPEGIRSLDVLNGTVRLHASVLAAPVGSCLVLASLVSDGDNVVVDDTCGLDGPGDRVLADPGLAPYDADLGYAAPRAGGPLVDAVETCTSDTDQLGRPRPSGPACDVGAIELQVPAPPQTSVPVTTTPGTTTTPATPAAPVVAPARLTG